MTGKLLGRLGRRGWRTGWRADRRLAKGRDERIWRREADEDLRSVTNEDQTIPDPPAETRNRDGV